MRTRLREITVMLLILAGFALLAAGTAGLRASMEDHRAERLRTVTEHPAGAVLP
ncbi:MAG: hypothetical protein R3247_07330 [Rhodothermales bacterium]|nr:hypothetical protein [Rhodothermales bacterium]